MNDWFWFGFWMALGAITALMITATLALLLEHFLFKWWSNR